MTDRSNQRPQLTAWQMARLTVNLIAAIGSATGQAAIPVVQDRLCRDLHRQITASALAEQQTMRSAIKPTSTVTQAVCLGIDAREHTKRAVEQGLRLDERTIELIRFREQQHSLAPERQIVRPPLRRRQERRR